MGLFGKSGSSFLNFSIMGELDKDKNIKKFVLLYCVDLLVLSTNQIMHTLQILNIIFGGIPIWFQP
ncbi:hypothetical protein D3Z55_22735 [Clostridiaceae bacterium]|nr:hypothetical protein [Clostridiaceae bacterium]